MKAVRLFEPGKPLVGTEIQPPAVGPLDLLIRVKAAGICHSDAHYRAGLSRVNPLPLTLGHEVTGIVEQTGQMVTRFRAGDRVCLHYMVTCGECRFCNAGLEQFCASGKMIGKYRDGGFAEYISVPARSAFLLPDTIPFEQGAVMMCSASTSLHALKKARMEPGETVAIFGAGGLGMSAIQLALAFGASRVFAVDIRAGKLGLAERLGAVPVNAAAVDPVSEIRRLTGGAGVNVALELIGLPGVMQQAVRALAIQGRLAIAGITDKSFEIAPYPELLNREAEIIGVSDHLASEIPHLIDCVLEGKLKLSEVVTHTVPLSAEAVNRVLDDLERFGESVRAVITPA
jgi:2-desacetyl-2-hydroxyethyl bacteriochlorophyllide A dehydrogenase